MVFGQGRNPHKRTSWKLVSNPGFEPKKVANYTVSQKNAPTLKRYSSEL